MDAEAILKAQLEKRGFPHSGFATLTQPLTMEFYREWIRSGHHASMTYLEEHTDAKEHPNLLSPRAKSAIVVAKPYLPHPYAQPVPKLKTALYAQGEDYHWRFKEELESLAHEFTKLFPDEEFLCFTDSAPILERDLAYRAGLGWIGKNTCLIDHARGSLFFIGEIYTSLNLTGPKSMVKDSCGACDKCIRACPTQALISPRKLDANLCIAYWTIEAHGDSPEALRDQFGDWFFGCDICQTVCPWNEKTHGRDLLRSIHEENPAPDLSDLRWILESSNKSLERAFQNSPLLRARPRGLKRSALRVIGYRRIQNLRNLVQRFKDDPHLGEIACWALARLS